MSQRALVVLSDSSDSDDFPSPPPPPAPPAVSAPLPGVSSFLPNFLSASNSSVNDNDDVLIVSSKIFSRPPRKRPSAFPSASSSSPMVDSIDLTDEAAVKNLEEWENKQKLEIQQKQKLLRERLEKQQQEREENNLPQPPAQPPAPPEASAPSEDSGPVGVQCTICLEPLTSDVVATNCGHLFHSSCISGWFKSAGKKCALCRKTVPAKGLRKVFF